MEINGERERERLRLEIASTMSVTIVDEKKGVLIDIRVCILQNVKMKENVKNVETSVESEIPGVI